MLHMLVFECTTSTDMLISLVFVCMPDLYAHFTRICMLRSIFMLILLHDEMQIKGRGGGKHDLLAGDSYSGGRRDEEREEQQPRWRQDWQKRGREREKRSEKREKRKHE